MRYLAKIALLAASAASMTSCRTSETQSRTDGKAGRKPLTVDVLFDHGGRGDKGFNDAAIAGAERAAKEFGVRVNYLEPPADGDRAAMVRQAASGDADLVVGVGFLFSQAFQQLAPELPRVRFAGVDLTQATDARGALVPLPANVAGIDFRENEGAFLVGAIAGFTSRSHTVGFVGGMDSPIIRRFEEGYRAGVRHACADCRVLVEYAGTTPAAFSQPERGRELALKEYGEGADIIFHAAGTTGNGVFQAARQSGQLVIGVDVDQAPLAPGHVLTSMTKRVDVAVYEAIRLATEGKLRTGAMTTMGLAERGVSYVWGEENRWLIPPDLRARVEQLRAGIIDGTISAGGEARVAIAK